MVDQDAIDALLEEIEQAKADGDYQRWLVLLNELTILVEDE